MRVRGNKEGLLANPNVRKVTGSHTDNSHNEDDLTPPEYRILHTCRFAHEMADLLRWVSACDAASVKPKAHEVCGVLQVPHKYKKAHMHLLEYMTLHPFI